MCAWCRRLNRHNAIRCGTCDSFWHQCQDTSYRHGQQGGNSPRKRTPSRSYASWNQGSNWGDQQGHGRKTKTEGKSTQSPRLKRADTPRGKKKSKKEQAEDIPSLDPPWNGDDNPALPSTSTSDNKAESRLQELVHELKKPGNTLTSGVQQIVSELPDSPAATAANMQSAVAKLEKARKNYKDAMKERQTMHSKWTKYLEQSVSRWQKFATEFTEKDQGLETKVQKAKEALQAARERVDITKEELTKVDAEILEETQEISDAEEEMDVTEKMDSADVIKAGITGMVSTLENISKLTAPADPEGQAAKRARTDEGGAGSTPAALVPFARPGK